MKNPNLDSTRKGGENRTFKSENRTSTAENGAQPSQGTIEPSQAKMEPKFEGKLQSKSRERETEREGALYFKGDTMKLGEAETLGGNCREARGS